MEIVNIVATVIMENKFNMGSLLDNLPNSELINHWVKIRLPKTNNYIAFYKNGKFLITGAKSEDDVYLIANEVDKYLKEHNIFNNIEKININTCVAIDQLNFDPRLDKLIIELYQYDAYYEPEQFPALKFKDKHDIIYLLFGSGKITITGVKSLDNLEEYVSEFKELIREKSSC